MTFNVTPAGERGGEHELQDLGAAGPRGAATGYTDQVVRVVSPVEGRFQRWGNWAEYDNWLENTAPAARRLGRSAAIQTIGVGETFDAPGRSSTTGPTTPQSGTVSLTLPANVTADATSKPYGPLAPGRRHDGQLQRLELVHERDAADHGDARRPRRTTNVTVRITTTYDAAAPGSEDLTLGIVPKTTIPAGGRRAGARRRRGRRRVHRRGARHRPQVGAGRQHARLRAGSASTAAPPARRARPTSTYAKVTRSGDDLYFFIHVRDDYQSYAVKPDECVAHWLADSVEILIDPRGNASQVLKDTANTFKLGVFPFTNDPANSNGNGANGPCWERDADNHQGYSTGPLAATVDDAPNAPGVDRQVDGDVGRLATTTGVDHSYGAAGGYNLEVKIPMADPPGGDRPGQHGPEHHALRRGQHGGRGHDDAAPHRPEHAAGLVDVRQRPVRPVPLGPRDAAGLHAAGRPPDDAGRRRTCRTRTSTAPTRRRRSPSRRATACRSPAACRRRRPRITVASARARHRRVRRSTSTRAGAGHAARRSSGRATRATSRCATRAAPRRPTRRRTTACRRAR